MKKNPTSQKQSRIIETTQKQVDYNEAETLDCIDGDCFDDDQRTFLEPCHECDLFTLPSRSSREGQILTDLARGMFLTNQSIYEAFGGTHDGRKALSLLRKEYGIQIDWELVNERRADRKHRIKPECLPFVQRRITEVWKLNLSNEAQRHAQPSRKARQSRKRSRKG